jgi:hypothetical protein
MTDDELAELRRITQRRQRAEGEWRKEIRRLFESARTIEEIAAAAGVRYDVVLAIPLGATAPRRRCAPGHYDEFDDSLVVERQAHCDLTLIGHLASLAPASDLVRPGKDVALQILELGLRLFRRELLVSAGLLKHLPARCDAMKRVARRHGFDLGIE